MKAVLAQTSPHLLFDGRYGWQQFGTGALSFWFRGFEQTRDGADLAKEAFDLGGDRQRIEAWLRGLDGFFALAVATPSWALAAADRVGSTPIIWTLRDGRYYVTQDGPALERELSLGTNDTDSDAARAIALAGYTIGSDTIYETVRRLTPGQYLLIDHTHGEAAHYHRWTPWQPSDAQPDDLIDPLSRVHENILDKLITNLGGRQVLVPLSAGLDSRMILSGLIEAGYRNVRAFSYGLPGNREARTAKAVADRLGVDWTFIPYSGAAQRRTLASAEHRAYEVYADSLTGIHFPQDFLAISELIRQHGIADDAIVVNGQTGDFITGNHILPPLTEPALDAPAEVRMERIIATTLRKHFKMWDALQRPEFLAPIRRRLREDIEVAGGLPDSADGDHGVYEYSEFVNRQSKYVIHGQRCYEFLGLDWRLPLWDRDYLDFWETAPLGAKRGQRLYRTVLERDNWGGVWRNLPINPLRIRPAWMVPVRFAFKAAHAPLGKARWHKFERHFLEYWMSPLCSYAPWSYRRIAADRRGHANALAWYCEAYLNAKGMAWDGSLAPA
jgi:asparagine synthase (glutamine-hydrolysing)